jgi:hypothetical protein
MFMLEGGEAPCVSSWERIGDMTATVEKLLGVALACSLPIIGQQAGSSNDSEIPSIRARALAIQARSHR